MYKTNKRYFLQVLMSLGLGLISFMASTMIRAEDMPVQPSIASPSTPIHDILSENNLENSASLGDSPSLSDSGDSSDNDTANDYDSTKESESENAAPIPSEEEDNPVLDEEGNVTIQGKNTAPQN